MIELKLETAFNKVRFDRHKLFMLSQRISGVSNSVTFVKELEPDIRKMGEPKSVAWCTTSTVLSHSSSEAKSGYPSVKAEHVVTLVQLKVGHITDFHIQRAVHSLSSCARSKD